MILKRLSSRLPQGVRQELRRAKAWWDIRRGRFQANDPEFQQLASFVKAGDWAIDVGANVGYYTRRLSELVGKEGRVIAVEPIPETVEILSYAVRSLPWQNVTILNMAASDSNRLLHFTVPVNQDTEMPDYFMARAVKEAGEMSVYACALDAIAPPHRVAFVKIDTEGHEYEVLRGMQRLIGRDRPTIVMEATEGNEPVRFLVEQFGYIPAKQAPNSANILLRPAAMAHGASSALESNGSSAAR